MNRHPKTVYFLHRRIFHRTTFCGGAFMYPRRRSILDCAIRWCFVTIANQKIARSPSYLRQFEHKIKAVVDEALAQGRGGVYEIKNVDYPKGVQYIPQLDFDQKVVDAFVKRQELRATCKTGEVQCVHNPFVTLPTVSGCGKTTFLAQFPKSVAYTRYAVGEGGEQPVVALVGSNDFRGDTLGLTLAYACLKTMGFLPYERYSRLNFQYRFRHFGELSGLEVLRVLRSILGTERKFLIGADSMYKGRQRHIPGIIKELGEILDNDGSTDVIVSTLAPPHFQGLARRSKRQIVSLPIPPHPTLWKCEEYAVNARYIIERAQVKFDSHVKLRCVSAGKVAQMRADFSYKSKLITGAAILAGGHPGTISYLNHNLDNIRLYKEEDCEWNGIESDLADPKVSAAELLYNIRFVHSIRDYPKSLNFGKKPQLRFVLSTLTYDPSQYRSLSRMFENRHCATAHWDNDRCKVYTTIFALLNVVEQFIAKKRRTGSIAIYASEHKTQLLLDSFIDLVYAKSASDSSDLWVRARALTLALRAFEQPAVAENGCNYVSFGTVSGAAPSQLAAGRASRRLWIHRNHAQCGSWMRNALTWTGDLKAGYVAYLCGYSEQERPALYCEAVLVDTGATNLLTIMARKIKYMISDRCVFALSPSDDGDSTIYCAFSRYVDPSPEEVAALCDNKALLQKMKELMEEDERSGKGENDINAWHRAVQYVREFYHTNVAVLHKKDLDETMPPTLLPLATLMQHLSEDTGVV